MAVASDNHRTREASYLWEGGMINLFIKVAVVGIKKKSTFSVRVPKSSSIGDLMLHLKVSKGIAGSIATNKKLSDKMTLAEAGIVTDTVVVVESYAPSKRLTHTIPVKLPNGVVINVQVHSGTTTEELKHKIQDVIGMPVEKQVLEYAGRPIKLHKLVIDTLYTNKKRSFVLKYRGRF